MSLLHLPVACTYIIYMQTTEKGAQWRRRSTGIVLHPTSLQDAAGGGDSCLSPAGEVSAALTVVWGAWTQNRVRRVISVGLRGHVYIQEALNLEPLDLRLSLKGSGAYYTFFFLILQPDLLVQEYSPLTQVILCCGNVTLEFRVLGPKTLLAGASGTDRDLLQGDLSCFFSFLNCAGLGLLSIL